MQSHSQTVSREKRRTRRSRVFYGAEILIDADLPPVQCTVKNVSGNGAKLAVFSGDLLPHKFELRIRKTNARHRACVTWHRGPHLGVTYIA